MQNNTLLTKKRRKYAVHVKVINKVRRLGGENGQIRHKRASNASPGMNSAFNAQSLRVIIVVVQVGAVKIYVTAVKALMEKERGDETQFTTKIDGKTSLGPSENICNSSEGVHGKGKRG
jgi:hypothetical protein